MEKIAAADYPIMTEIAGRWSPRSFKPESVETDKLHSILEAARWAASCFNEQPWSYLVAVREKDEAFQTMVGCLVEANQTWAKNAGALVIGVAQMNFSRNGNANAHAKYDLGQATAHMALQARAMGLVAHQMAGIEYDKIKEVYQLADGLEPVVAIAIGAQDEPEQLPEGLANMERGERTRKAQADFVTFT